MRQPTAVIPLYIRVPVALYDRVEKARNAMSWPPKKQDFWAQLATQALDARPSDDSTPAPDPRQVEMFVTGEGPVTKARAAKRAKAKVKAKRGRK